MIQDESTFLEDLRGLKMSTGKRDPRSVRLAAVTKAIVDIINEEEATPAKIYASAVTTLEGTLQQQYDLGYDFLTQVALLELIRFTVPYVARNTLRVTLAMSSRVIRTVVTVCCDMIDDNDTKDELGGINATLRASCRTTTQILLTSASSTQEKNVRRLLQDTLIRLWDDRRPKVRKAAQEGAYELVVNGLCGSFFTKFSLSQIDSNNTSTMLHTLHWLRMTISHLNIEELGKKIMETLLSIIKPISETESDFVTDFSKCQAQVRVLSINGILTLLVSMMEEQEIQLENSKEKQLNEFAARVLATLLQMKTTLIFISNRNVDEEIVEDGKSLYGKALMLACQRVSKSKSIVANKLLPLTVQRVVQISKPEQDNSITVAKALLPELTKMFRGAAVIEEVMHIMEAVLQNSYRATWSVSLLPLAILLRQNQNSNIISRLIQLHPLDKKSVEEAVGSIIQEIGLQKFWKFITWKFCGKRSGNKQKENRVIDANQTWLLCVLKTFGSLSVIRPDLSFFQATILPLARECDKIAAADGNEISKSHVLGLWSLFDCFCLGTPKDFSDSFLDIIPTLIRAMGDKRYPKLVIIICRGLKSLAESIQNESSRQVLSRASTMLLPALFRLLEILQESPKRKFEDQMDLRENNNKLQTDTKFLNQRISVISAISELARAAPSSYLQSLLKKILQRLLTASQSTLDESENICTLLNLSQALVPVLDKAGVALVFRSAKPLIRSDEQSPRVQKHAYKVLLTICQWHTSFCTDPDRLTELTDLLVDSIMTCHISARYLRIKCMTLVMKELQSKNNQHMNIIPKVLGEVLLCLKDSNDKTREAAYQLVLSTATVMDSMQSYLKIVAAALGAITPHMRSAAVMAMSRLVFEYARDDVVFQKFLPSMLQTVIVLFNESSKEVIKSVIGFVRICVASMTSKQLEPLLPELIGGLFKYHTIKDRFRAKIKIILKKLVRLYGYNKLLPYVPESDSRLLTHMRKLSERGSRRKEVLKPDGQSNVVDFDEMMESDEEDSDDGHTLITRATRATRFPELTGRTGKNTRNAAKEQSEKRTLKNQKNLILTSDAKTEGIRLKNDNNGDIIDLLNASKSVQYNGERDSESNDADSVIMEFDEGGRLIVSDDHDNVSTRQQISLVVEDDENCNDFNPKRLKISKFESAKASCNQSHQKRRKIQNLGAAYKSKKAGGDLRKKGQKFEPYAFVPLIGKSYTKSNRKKTVETMSTVVSGGGKRKR